MQVIEYKNIHSLKRKWSGLYQKSTNPMTPLQSYIPNKLYFNRFRLALHRLQLHPRFIYASDCESEIILPIIIDHSQKRITEFAPLDYYDVIAYGSTHLAESVVDWLKIRYPGYRISFSRINPSGTLFTLYGSSCTVSEKCVSIPLHYPSFEDYIASLSKHQRQNIRTAYHRLDREQIMLSLSKYENNTLLPKNINKACRSIFTARYETKNFSISAIKQWYHRFSLPVFQIMEAIDSGAFFVLSFNNKPVAFMAGAYSKDKSCFTVPVLFSSNDYLRYSPGIILLAETARLLISEGTEVLDLARGNEFYKFAMGGVGHFTFTFSISLTGKNG